MKKRWFNQFVIKSDCHAPGMILAQFKKLFAVMALAITSQNAGAVPVDLNAFTPVLPSNVTIATDGSSARLAEDMDTGVSSLENFSFSIPVDAVSLSFDYELVLPIDNEDYFDFYIDNLSVPEFSVGRLASADELIFNGTHTVDVTPWQGSVIPIIFDIQYGFDDWAFDSFVTIDNVNLEAGSVGVPEPATFSLLIIALLALTASGKITAKRATAD